MPKLRLKVTHTHAGVAYPPGHVIDVDANAARWLLAQQVGEHVPADVPRASPEPLPVAVEASRPRFTRSPKE